MKKYRCWSVLGLLAWFALIPRFGLAGPEPAPVSQKVIDTMELPYGKQKTVEFVCPWDHTKIPTVLDFKARIDTPGREASSGGPVPLLTIELNGVTVEPTMAGSKPRLLNKPLKFSRPSGDAPSWFDSSRWALMYAGSFDPPPNDYTPKQGSPVQFVLDVTDLLRSNATNKLALTYFRVMTADADGHSITLAEHCHKGGYGDATVLLGGMQLRPRNEITDVIPAP